MPATAPPPRPRMRPPRPWVPDDPPETVLPVWMSTRREPHFPHPVVRPGTLPPPEEPVRPRRARHRRDREPRSGHLRLTVPAALFGAVLGGYACLTPATPAALCAPPGTVRTTPPDRGLSPWSGGVLRSSAKENRTRRHVPTAPYTPSSKHPNNS